MTAVVIVVIVLLVVAAVAVALTRRAEPAELPHVAAAPPADDRRIQSLINDYDLADASARVRIGGELLGIGVEMFDAAPQTPFDSHRHKAVLTAPAPRPDRVGLVAESIRPGWRDHRGILRFPEVAVYVDSAPMDPLSYDRGRNV